MGKSVLLDDQTIKKTKARVYVYSDSVLCLGKMHGPEDAIKKWNDQVATLKMCHTFRELQGLDGEPIDFEWKIFPGATALDLLHEIQADLQGKHVTPENFGDRKFFMSMLTTLSWKREEMKILVLLLQRRSKSTPRKATMDILGTRRRKQVG